MKLVSVRLPAEEADRLKVIAAAECRTLTGHIRFLLQKELEERGEKAWSQ